MHPVYSAPQPTRQSKSLVPMPSNDGPAVEDLRTRAVLARVHSPALAAVIASLAYSVPENLRGAR